MEVWSLDQKQVEGGKKQSVVQDGFQHVYRGTRSELAWSNSGDSIKQKIKHHSITGLSL